MKTLFEQWQDGEGSNLGNFTTTLFRAYQYADFPNRAKLKLAFPEYFEFITSPPFPKS